MTKKVFVSGCYDMLHSGHVAFFEEASRYGDLYVGIGSDRTIYQLKGRKTINNEQERLYMVKAVRYVKDAFISSGSGIMDFEQEVIALKPDIFFVNTDGFTPEKEQFCKKHNIQLVVSSRIPSAGLPARSTTALRQECTIPFRVELCGGWLDQPFVNQICPGAVITASIEPDIDFNYRSGMATSSRKAAIKLWQTAIPAGDPMELAKILFCIENPPGCKHISGSQDQLGIILPGINKLNYDNGFWPVSVENISDPETIAFVENHLYLLQCPPRQENFDVYEGKNITPKAAAQLAQAAEEAWTAIKNHDADAWGKATEKCFSAQLEMFPNTASKDLLEMIGNYGNTASGWKFTGAGGGGYLMLISKSPIPNTTKIHIRLQ